MKKSLLALAAMGAFSGAAQAQSSVTVYGILDVGVIGGFNRAAGATTPKSGGIEFGQGAESTTRLGFRGTEDLGGGMRAFFTLEMALAMNGTNTLGSASNSNRQSFVGLGQKGIGSLSIGTQYTTAFELAAATSPGQLNNIAGDVIYGQQTNVGIANASAADLAAQNANSGSNVGFTVRTGNMLKLASERMAGFQGTAFYTLDNNDSTQRASAPAGGYRGGNNNRTGWGAGLNYSAGKAYVGVSYQALTAKNPYGTNACTLDSTGAVTCTADGAAQIFGSSNNTGVNIKDNQFLAGATYDFGILKAYAQYVNRKATSELNSAIYAQRSAQQIGVRGMVTKQIEGWASAGLGRYQQYGQGLPTANFNGWQLGSNYILSKRTNLYAIYGQTITSSTTGSNNSAGTSNYAMGIRHTF